MVADLFHRGHVDYIKCIKNTGDLLVIGLPPDDVVSYYEKQIIMPFEDRKAILKAMSLVDLVVEDCMALRSPTTIDNLKRFKINVFVYGLHQPASIHLKVKKENLCKTIQIDHYPLMTTAMVLQKIEEVTAVTRIRPPTVVYAYVCGDLLHEGHLLHLENAKALGDRLIVGVLTDKAIMEKKPAPTMAFKERLELVKGLKFVDCAVPQDVYSPVKNVISLRPDILAESTSHQGHAYLDTLQEQFKGRIVMFPYYKEQSSTAIKDKIRNTK